MNSKILVETKCQDYGQNPNCLGDIDEKFTMRFDDLKESPVYWCTNCGVLAAKMMKLLEQAFKTKDPEFAQELETLIAQAEEDTKARRS